MGSVCCVAARDTTITNRPATDMLQRNVRQSPSWSFRWENRGRVAGEETSVNWRSSGVRDSDRYLKSGTSVETTYASEEGSPLDSFRSVSWQKSPSEENSGALRLPSSDLSSTGNLDVVKESMGSPIIQHLSPSKFSPSAPSFSSLSMSPLSSKSQGIPPSLTPSRWSRHSPGHRLSRQVSDSRIAGFRSPTLSISEEASSLALPGWSNESTRGSNGGSSDTWSIPTFPETSRRGERWSFDSESFGFNRDKITRSSGRSSASPSFDLRSCGICAKLLTEKSLFAMATSELAVVAVLQCGHVYHAECLENMTAEVNKYDPACPVCTFGEKQALKMSEKVSRAEMESKARKKSRYRVHGSDRLVLDRQKSCGNEERGPKMSSSSSMKSPFLKRHFSFGSKASRSLSENHSSRKKVFFWAKSSKQ